LHFYIFINFVSLISNKWDQLKALRLIYIKRNTRIASRNADTTSNQK